MLQDAAELTDPMRAVLRQICSLLECDQVSESLCHTFIALCIWHARTHSDLGFFSCLVLTLIALSVVTLSVVTLHCGHS